MSTIQLIKDPEVSAHRAVIVGISDLSLVKICIMLKFHPMWIMESVFCKAFKIILRARM